MARYLANEKAMVDNAREKVEQVYSAYSPPDSMPEDEILAAAVRAIEALQDLAAALNMPR